MKTKLTILCVAALMCLMLTSPATAGNIGPNAGGGSGLGSGSPEPACAFSGSPAYCNAGSTGFTTDAWTINSGFSVTDSFTVAAGTTVTSSQIVTWLFPGDSISSIDWAIGSSSFGSDLGAGTASVSNMGDSTNQFGFTTETDGFALGGGVLLSAGGTYWLTLQNASAPSGDPIYWDENGGASSAFENSVGSIPSESFAMYGSGGGGGAPEPGTLVLGGSGLLLLAGALRRKLNK